MPEIAIMIEGQDGVNWTRWKRLARAVEDLGFAGLYRSDHFTNPDGPNKDSLELWVSLTWLASHTERIEFGPLVTPVSFRHPVFTARIGKDVDTLSGGRLTLGVGAGWQDREHHTFGFDLLNVSDRFDRFEEGVQVIHSLLRQSAPVSFEGEYYELHDAQLLPRPLSAERPRLLIGGNGRNRTLPLAAEYADEWNGVFSTPEQFADLNSRLDELLTREGRQPEEVRRSLMTQVVFGRNDAEVEHVLDGRDRRELREHGIIVGTASAVVDYLGRLDDAGVQRVMLQWLDLDALDRLEALAEAIL